MGVLDQQDREGTECRRQQPDPPTVETTPNQEDQNQREEIEAGRGRPPYQVNLVVSGLAGPLTQNPHQEDRQRAVNEKRVPFVVRIYGGTLRVEVLGQVFWQLDAGFHHRKESLIRMHMGLAVPILPGKAKNRTHGQDTNQQQDGTLRGRRWLRTGSGLSHPPPQLPFGRAETPRPPRYSKSVALLGFPPPGFDLRNAWRPRNRGWRFASGCRVHARWCSSSASSD